MKYNHLPLLAVFLSASLLGCHSNNTPPPAPLHGTTKEGTPQTVYLPNFVRPNEVINVPPPPKPTPTPFITASLSNGQVQYTITDDKGTSHPHLLPRKYRKWSFSYLKAVPYKAEAQVTGSTNGKTLYTHTVNPNDTPGYYDVHWSTKPPP
jgi:hypothetical protein